MTSAWKRKSWPGYPTGYTGTPAILALASRGLIAVRPIADRFRDWLLPNLVNQNMAGSTKMVGESRKDRKRVCMRNMAAA